MLLKEIRSSLILLLLMIGICGFFYNFSLTKIAEYFFPKQANGSLILSEDGKVLGSELLAIPFAKCNEKYFLPRPSLTNFNDPNPENNIIVGSASNLSQANKELIELIVKRYNELKLLNPDTTPPLELLNASASGLDPNLSKEAVIFQLPIVAKARNVKTEELIDLIDKNMQKPLWGIFGSEMVNVVLLNRALDKKIPIDSECKIIK